MSDLDCRCASIMEADASRHFRGCPMRAVYPEPGCDAVNLDAMVTTASGINFFPLRPTPEMVDILDIATHLSLTCRYGGAMPSCKLYSVAQHSVLVSMRAMELAREVQRSGSGLWPTASEAERLDHQNGVGLLGLLHDAAEAYPPGDIVGPLKRSRHPAVAGMVELQDAVERVIFAKFEIRSWASDDEIVRRADQELLATEQRDLRGFGIDTSAEPLRHTITDIWDPERARLIFLLQFQVCSGKSLALELASLVPAFVGDRPSGWESNDRLLTRMLLAELELKPKGTAP